MGKETQVKVFFGATLPHTQFTTTFVTFALPKTPLSLVTVQTCVGLMGWRSILTE